MSVLRCTLCFVPNTFNPWETQEALTAERLSEVATALRDARDDALNSYEPLKGETVWTLGCSKYERSMLAVRELAKSNPTWITLVPESARLRCTFAVDGVPIRFYHHVPEFDPPTKYTTSTDGEDRYQMLFEVDGVPFRRYRLAIEDDSAGKVKSVTLVEFDSTGALINEYTIPFDLAPSKVLPLQAKGVSLAPISLEPLERRDEKAKNDEEDNSGTGTK